MEAAQKELIFTKRSIEEAEKLGYPTFNKCNHYTVDMSHLDHKSKDHLVAVIVFIVIVKTITMKRLVITYQAITVH